MLRTISADKVFMFFISAFAFFTPIGKAPANVSFAIAFFAGVFLLKKYNFHFSNLWRQPLVKPLGYLLLVIFITLFFSTDRRASFQEYPRMIVYVMPFLLFAAFRTCRETSKLFHIKRMLQSYVAGSALASCYAIYQFVQTRHLYVTGFYIHHSIFGSFLEMAMPIIATLFLEERSLKKRCLYLLAAVLCIAALLLSQARGPWVGAAAALFTVGYVMRRKLFANKKAVLAASIVILLFMMSMLPFYMGRAKTLTDPRWPSNYNRLYIWESSINMIKDYPLTGVGFDQFREVCNPKYVSPFTPERYHPHAHNSFLMMGVETGLIGLIAFLYLLFRIYKWLILMCRLNPTGYNAAILAILVAITINSMVDNFFWAAYLAKIIWFFLGISVYANKNFIND